MKNSDVNIRGMQEGIIDLLGTVVESRDKSSGVHVQRVKGFTYIIANQLYLDHPELGLTEDDVIRIAKASALHDVGKIYISDSILLKPGRLTKEEFDIMKSHCDKGCEIIEKMKSFIDKKYFKISMDIVRYHHEKWDGKGYPCGLKENEIPISAQIVSIADIFDALISKRSYKDSFTYNDAFNMIVEGNCGVFSEMMLECFAKCKKHLIMHAEDPDQFLYSSLYEFDDGGKYKFEPVEDEDTDTTTTTTVQESIDKQLFFEEINILLVDDNTLIREINTEILKARGAHIYEACSGREAVECVKAKKPVDIILMDIVMDDMDGIEATKSIRALEKHGYPYIPIFGLTSDANSIEGSMIVEAGATECLTKPLKVSEFGKKIISELKKKK